MCAVSEESNDMILMNPLHHTCIELSKTYSVTSTNQDEITLQYSSISYLKKICFGLMPHHL
jgi:hypothetical protein